MTIVRVGATEKYSEGWESAFGKKKSGPAKKTAGKAAKAVSAKSKASGKKKSKKKR